MGETPQALQSSVWQCRSSPGVGVSFYLVHIYFCMPTTGLKLVAPACLCFTEPHVDFLEGFLLPEGACSPLPGRKKGLHASLTGCVYPEKRKLFKERDVCTEWGQLPFLKHSDTLEGCQILQLLRSTQTVNFFILFNICLSLNLIKNRLRSWGWKSRKRNQNLELQKPNTNPLVIVAAWGYNMCRRRQNCCQWITVECVNLFNSLGVVTWLIPNLETKGRFWRENVGSIRLLAKGWGQF